MGPTTTSAYRAYKRMPGLAERWDESPVGERPPLEQAAFDRAIAGGELVIVRDGREVARHRKPSDMPLRYLLERDRREAAEKARVRAVAEADRLREAGLVP